MAKTVPINEGTKTKDKKTTVKKNITVKDKADRRYQLIKEIKESPLYKRRDISRDVSARTYITGHAEKTNGKKIVPGQLILFKYLNPLTEEDLEYYDASPCTIFFGTFNSKNGLRILGFNIHYYPPKMRYAIMNKIFDLYRPIYTKYFAQQKKSEIEAFDYQTLIEQLNRMNLGFGVREYAPTQMGEIYSVPPNMWHVSVFTEGWFRKQSRTAIMKFWEKWLRGTKKSGNETHKKYKSKQKKK